MNGQEDSMEKQDILREVIYAIPKLNGLLLGEGERAFTESGLTSARWRVLGVLFRSSTSLTIPEIAREIGQTRQAVLRQVDNMVRDNLIDYRDNPAHATSRKVVLTLKGRKTYRSLQELRDRWGSEVASQVKLKELKAMRDSLNKFIQLFERK